MGAASGTGQMVVGVVEEEEEEEDRWTAAE